LPSTKHIFRNTHRDILTIENDEVFAIGTLTASNINVINKVTTFNKINITNDSNTVPFSITHRGSSANMIEISDENRMAFVVSNDGNVGVGALKPEAAFHAINAPIVRLLNTSNFTPFGLPNDTMYGMGHAVSDDELSLFIGVPGSSQVNYIRRASKNSPWESISQIVGASEERLVGDRFGSKIRMSESDNGLWISAPGSEKVFKFAKVGMEWVPSGDNVLGIDEGSGTGYGSDFDVSGDGLTVVVGAPNKVSNTGAAYIHQYSTGSWSTSVLEGPFPGAVYGSATRISGDGSKIFVGARGVKSVSIYERTITGTYAPIQVISSSLLDFGISLAYNEFFLAVGAQDGVHLYTILNNTWVLYQSIVKSGGYFGRSVSLSKSPNSTLVVGDTINNVHGTVQVYTHNSTYFRKMQDIVPIEVEAVQFGEGVLVSNNNGMIVVYGTGLNDRGLLYAYDINYQISNGLVVQFDGNVGIGTTAPGSKLAVHGDVNIVGALQHYGVPIGYGALGGAQNTLQVAPYRFVHEITEVLPAMSYILDGRYVLTASKTDVFVNGIKLIYMNNGIQDYSVSFYTAIDKTNVTLTLRAPLAYNDFVEVVFWPEYEGLNATNNFGVAFQEFNGLFENSPDNTSNIYYNWGNVGIGTTWPQQKLHVEGNTFVSGQSLAINGSAVSPSFSWSNYKTTGMFAPRANTLAFATNAVERLCIIDNGNIGIGTTTPRSFLHIEGDIIHTKDILASTGGYTLPWFRFQKEDVVSSINGINIGIGAGQMTYVGGGESAAAMMGGEALTTEQLVLSSDQPGAAAAIRMVTNLQGGYATRTEALTIFGNGNVGIGTTIPQQLLHVNGTILSSTISCTNASVSDTLTLANNKGLYWAGNTDGASINYYSTSDATGASYLEIKTFDNTDEPIVFKQTNTERMRIHSNGYVGIGTATPQYMLDVFGNIKVSGFVYSPNTIVQTIYNQYVPVGYHISTTSTAYIDLPQTQTIVTKLASSKIKIEFFSSMLYAGGNVLYCDLHKSINAGSYVSITTGPYQWTYKNDHWGPMTLTFLDVAPATPSSITYKVMWRMNTGTGYLVHSDMLYSWQLTEIAV